MIRSFGARGLHDAAVAGRYIRRWCWDWVNERARTPGLLLGAIVLILAPPLHLSVTAILVANWVIGRVPTVNSLIQAIRIGQFRRWSRPQSYQDPGVVSVEPAPETGDKPWKVFRWQRALTRRAERNRGFAVLDDWLNERSRLPGFILDLSSLAAGLLMPLPTSIAFAINFAFDRVPMLNNLSQAIVNRSLRRFNRPGSYQRPTDMSGLRIGGHVLPGRETPEPFALPAPDRDAVARVATPMAQTRAVAAAVRVLAAAPPRRRLAPITPPARRAAGDREL